MRPARLGPFVLAVPGLLGSWAACALTLPARLPARDAGSWLIEQTSTIGAGATTVDIQKIWKICLDAKTDRALHELVVREQQASLASLKAHCEEPRPTLAGNELAWTMRCAGPSSADDDAAEVRHRTTFISSDETRGETMAVTGKAPDDAHGRFVIHMTRAGVCESGLKPGDMMLMHWRANGEETLKGRQFRTLREEIAHYKALTASRLAR